MSDLSQLNAVRAFEAVARTGSYARAADELHVTPAAVGQHVRALEAWLGVALFRRLERGPNRLELTEQAKTAAIEVGAALDMISRGLARLREASRDVLTVTASQAFVGKWLMARLDSFTSVRPTLEIRLDVSDRVVDVAREAATVAIRCGSGRWPGLVVTKLMGEEVFPVCSPLLAGSRTALTGDLGASDVALVHDAMQEGTGAFPTWRDWLSRAGMTLPKRSRGLRVNSSVAAIQAAIGGTGIALARSALVKDDIANGLLVRLRADISFPVEWAYWLVRGAEADARPQVAEFRDWLVQNTSEATTRA